MQCLEARLASYSAVTRPKKSSKVAFPLTSSTHPHLTPEALSQAGFYHKPSQDDPDTYDSCVCFLCGLVLGGWDEDDDPFGEHVRREGQCAWKEIVCRLQVDRDQGGPGRLRSTFPNANALPSSAVQSAYREKTFGDWWPHSEPSARDLALAGFISTPTKSAPDGTMCPLCRYEVEEWEPKDDPLAIHRRKEPQCPFFTATVQVHAKGASTSKAPRSTKSAASKRSRATTAVVAESEPEPQPEPQPEPETESQPAPSDSINKTGAEVDAAAVTEGDGNTETTVPAPRRRGRPRGTTATAASTRGGKTGRGKKTKAGADEDVGTDNGAGAASGVEVAAPLTAAAVSNESVEHDDAQDNPDDTEAAGNKARSTKPLPKPKGTRGRKKKVDTEPEQEQEQSGSTTSEPPMQPAKAKAKPKPKAKSKAAKSKPVPTSSSVPISTTPTSTPPPILTSSAPLSQLDRFTNLPPPPPASGLTQSKPGSSSLQRAVEEFIRAATPFSDAAAVPASTTGQGEEGNVNGNDGNDEDGSVPRRPLTEEEKDMTLEEYVRAQFRHRHDEMRKEGEAKIARWEAKAAEVRKRLESM